MERKRRIPTIQQMATPVGLAVLTGILILVIVVGLLAGGGDERDLTLPTTKPPPMTSPAETGDAVPASR